MGSIWFSIVLGIHVTAALGIIGFVLIQHGKGADAGAAFGSGASGSASLFGASGSANFLSRTTAILALVFFVTSLSLTYFASHRVKTTSVLDSLKSQPAAAKPAEQPAAAGASAPAAPGAPAGEESGKVKEIPK